MLVLPQQQACKVQLTISTERFLELPDKDTPARKLPVKLILYVLYIGRDSHRNLSCLILIRIGEKTHCNAVNNDRGINTQFHVIKEHIIVYAVLLSQGNTHTYT